MNVKGSNKGSNKSIVLLFLRDDLCLAEACPRDINAKPVSN